MLRTENAFNEELKRILKKEKRKNQLQSIGVPNSIIILVIDWEDKYFNKYVSRVLKGQDPTLGFSVEVNVALVDKLKETELELSNANKHIDDLIKCGDILEENCNNYCNEIKELKDIIHIQKWVSQANHSFKDERIKELENELIDKSKFKSVICIPDVGDSYTYIKLAEKDLEIKRLKQEVNSKTWGKNKPYKPWEL